MERKEKQFYKPPTATVLELAAITIMVGSTEDYEYVNLDEA